METPPLYTRKEDIEELTLFFIQRFAHKENTLPKDISSGAIQKLQHHNWPGNVRELENTINRSLVLADKEVLEEHDIVFFATTSSITTELSHGAISCVDINGDLKPFKEIEHEIYSFAIKHSGNNIPKAAKSLHIAKSTLYRKINES